MLLERILPQDVEMRDRKEVDALKRGMNEKKKDMKNGELKDLPEEKNVGMSEEKVVVKNGVKNSGMSEE